MLVATLGLLATACGDDHHNNSGCGLEANCTPDLLDSSDGVTVAGDQGQLKVRIISATPNPPDPSMTNTWTVEILDAQDQPVSGASITRINTWSIDCGHFGVEGQEGLDLTGIDNGDGTFTFEFLYAHGGPWDVELDISDGSVTDTVAIGLCLPETGEHSH